MIDSHDIQKFFFNAMVDGWAVSGKESTTPDMPQYYSIWFTEGEWTLLDRYCTTPLGPKSAGTTTIWYQQTPVWVMNYGGLYEDRAIPVLQHAIAESYNTRAFAGGRGPRVFSEGNFRYTNDVRMSDFAKFEGREEIIDTQTNTVLGWHEYWGMSLL